MPRAQRALLSLAACVALGSVCGCATIADPEPDARDRARVSELLDSLHAHASRADFDAYFACFDSRGVFLGTDASERWSVEEFKAYAKPHFAAGRGWTYAKAERHVDFVSGDVAYFDELLDNAKYGRCRGSGVVVRWRDGAWKIRQYNLSFTVPNDAAEEVAAVSRRVLSEGKTPAGK